MNAEVIDQGAATPRPSSTILLFGGVVLVYFAAGKLGLSFALVQASTSAVWPPTGLALAAVLLIGRRIWPAILLGAFLVNYTTTDSAPVSLAIAIGNTAEALLAGTLLHRFCEGRAAFDRSRNIFKFALLAAFVSTATSATIGVTSLSIAGQSPWHSYGIVWMTWWLGNAIGAITVTPLLLLWYQRPRLDRRTDRPVEMFLMLVSTGALTGLIFLGDRPLAFLCLAPLAWAAFRFRQREVATATALMALLATIGTSHGSGPFAIAGHHASLVILQAFIGTLGITTLAIAAFAGEHRLAIRDAESASRAKDQFLALLSHELRNPLQAIGSAAEILRGHPLPPAALQASEIVRRQTAHLSHLVGDLLDFERMIEGKTHLVQRPLDLSDIVRRCVETAKAAGKAKRHAIELSLISVWVNGDPDRLVQVVTNLLTNALKYTPDGGVVRISVSTIGDHGLLVVEDNGVGMHDDLISHIFEPFTQGERTLDRRQGGLGLGLTLVRRLVELHGGSVEAQSKGPARGSEFLVRLPAISPPEPTVEAEEKIERVQSVNPRRILIVEDNADAREALRSLLESLGHDVSEAADGLTGVEAGLRLRPQVAIIDIGLPELDGFGVAEKLRSSGIPMKLIALTGYGQPEDRRKAHEAGFDEHLTKPMALEALLKAIA